MGWRYQGSGVDALALGEEEGVLLAEGLRRGQPVEPAGFLLVALVGAVVDPESELAHPGPSSRGRPSLTFGSAAG